VIFDGWLRVILLQDWWRCPSTRMASLPMRRNRPGLRVTSADFDHVGALWVLNVVCDMARLAHMLKKKTVMVCTS
ncbi:uncharacterized protein METZ01_LOCUS91493, partial [marine metagenome]